MSYKTGAQALKFSWIMALLMLSLPLLSVYVAGVPAAAAATPVSGTPTVEVASPETTPTPEKPLTLEEYIERGQASLESGEFEAAMADFSRAARLERENADIYYWRGLAFKGLQNLKRAIADFDKALELNADLTAAYLERGDSHLQSGNLWQALSDLDEAILQDSELAEAYIKRGLTNFRLDYPEDAVSDLDEALQLEPESAQAYAVRGLAYARAGENQAQALADLEEAVRLAPEDPAVYLARGNVYVQAGDYKLALADFEEAIGLEPGNALLYLARASAYAGAGDNDTAVADLEQAVALSDNSDSQERMAALVELLQDPAMEPEVAGLIARGAIAMEEMSYYQAIPIFSEAMDLAPDNSRPYYWRGGGHYAVYNYDEAVADYTQAIELDPAYAAAYYRRGVVNYFLDDNEQAIADFGQAIELNPDDPAPYYWRGLTHYYLDDNEQALADLSQAVELAPDNPDPYFWRADVYQYGLRDFQQAIPDYTQALDLGYSNPAEVYRWRAEAYARQGLYEQSRADFELAVALSPDDASAYNALCWFGSLLGHAEDVLAACDEAVALEPDSWDHHDSRGLARALTGDEAGAIEDFEAVIEFLKVDESYQPGAYGREDWLAALKAGQNPFDQATLEALLAPGAVEAETVETEDTPKPAETQPPAEAAAQEGFNYLDQEKYDEAIAAFQQAIGLDAAYGPAYLGLGYAYAFGPGNFQQAIQALETYLKLIPDASDRASVEEDIAYLKGLLAQQKPAYDIPAGKALFVFRNYCGVDWNIDVGPYFVQVPAKPADKEYAEGTVVIDPGKYTWKGHSPGGGYYLGGEGGNQACEFTVAAGEVHTEGCR